MSFWRRPFHNLKLGRRYGLWDFGMGLGSSSHLFGIGVYGDHHGKWWHTYLFMPIWSVGRGGYEAQLWFNYRFNPKHQYHLINTGLEPGYYDVDTLMLNGCFALLKRYVEQEMGGVEKMDAFTKDPEGREEPVSNGTPTADQASSQSEASKLYRWWTVERPADLARDEELVHRLYGKDGLIRMHTEPTPDGKFHNVGFEERTAEAKVVRAEHRALEAKIHKDAQDMLHRLIDIRGGLWT